jgi:hypothetical protein
MDFFDPQKQKQHAIRLAVGYALIAVVLILATTVLLYRSYGFGLDENGRVIQNGLVFVSSTPEGATVYVNGKKYKDQTNTRMDIPDGEYTMEITKQGYRTWERSFSLEGGSIERFYYPLLFPVKPKASVTKQYATLPAFTTQSIDRRWLLVGAADQNSFDLFDLKAKKPIARPLTVPVEVLAAGSTTKAWSAVEWSRDNRHILLQRSYLDKTSQPGNEYILFDREDAASSQNLSVVLGFTPTTIQLRNGAYDTYYVFDAPSKQLFTASLKRPTPQPYISDTLAFASDANTVTYVTAQDADAGKVRVMLREGDGRPFTLRQLPADTLYLLDMARYSGKLYAIVSAQSENRAYIFRDPLRALQSDPNEPLVPTQLLKLQAPTHVSFSANKRMVLAESGDHFAVYDAETKRAYLYQASLPMDGTQGFARWLDGFRMSYASGGQLVVMDYDGANGQALGKVASFPPFFDPDYRFMYTVTPESALTNTALRIDK